MKNSLIALTAFFTLNTYCQNKEEYPKLSFEFGGGYEYAHLKNFNEDFIDGDYFEVYDNQLHSGWSISAKVPFHFNRLIDLGTDFSFKQFRIKDNLSPISLDPSHAFHGAIEYEKLARLTAYEGGFSSAFWLSKLFNNNKESKLSMGFDGIAAYGIVRFISIVSYTFPSGDIGHNLSQRVENDYFRFGGGLDFKYDIEKSIFNSILVKIGYTTVLNSFDGVDLGGYYGRVMFNLGKSTKNQ